MMNNLKIASTFGLALLLGGLVLVGCESDSVAPNDEIPPLTEENVAYQAALIDMAMAEIAPVLLNYTPGKAVYTYTFEGYDYVDGMVYIDYRLGGSEGADATPSEADYAHLYTASGDTVRITTEDIDFSAMLLTGDIMADLDQEADTATVRDGSEGSLVAGEYTGTYMIDGFAVGRVGYPTAGEITFIGGGHTLVSAFDGTNLVVISVDGAATWWLNLDDGLLSDFNPPTK